MDRDNIRSAIAAAVGNPTSGPIADAIDAITEAVLALASPAKPAKETRVMAPAETRDEEALP